ncbi:9-O-acetylesterase [bacterium]|nr:MAG: 9-O-acetylesterase [bacterium]
MKNSFLCLSLLACLAVPLVSTQAVFAQAATATDEGTTMPLLHPLFSNNAVLQRDRSIPIWGWATPGHTINVGIDGKKYVKTRVGTDGKWMVHVGPYKTGDTHTLTVDGGPGEMATRTNILFGDVWLCSGQSNMEMGMTLIKDAEKEIAEANYPNIRLFTVKKAVTAVPQKLTDSEWLPCNPTTVASGGWGGFSAVAYFFGRKLNEELGVPIGLINSSWGGTIAEAWVNESALGEMKDFNAQIDVVKKVAQNTKSYKQLQDEWYAAADPGTKEGWAAPNFNDADWKTMKTPGDWDESPEPEFKNFDGIGWYRRQVGVPAAYAGKDIMLHLGGIDDDDTTFWNGVEIGRTPGVGALRNYKVPGVLVKPGNNVISVRVYDMVARGGLYGDPGEVKLELDTMNSLPLAGDWKFKTSASLAQLADAPARFDNPNTVTVLNNGMIAPLVPYGLKGAIWYQGESNESRPEQYARLLPTLIKGWRKQFDNDFPFYIVQLAGFRNPDNEPRNDEWPRLRESQMKTANTVDKTGIAIAIDIGDAGDIHPRNKQDVGLRLALNTLAQDYGKKVKYAGPTLNSTKRDGDKLVVRFENTDGGLTLDGDANHVFAIAGADKKFVWADATVKGDTVILSSPEVKEPSLVRYGWSNLPRANLHNGLGLPAAPFRTDK